MEFESIFTKNNVVYLSEEKSSFSTLYLFVREKERRLLNDEEVAKLPFIDVKEWRLRQKSSERFINYLSNRKIGMSILDIGCGNGWFTNLIDNISTENIVYGIDINKEELEQAARIFKNDTIKFIYGDIFQIKNQFHNGFDIIILNSSVQYFEDFGNLFFTLKSFLRQKGEIHILDSPFYNTADIPEAKKRTLEYYTNLGYPQMAKNYFHHSTDLVKDFEYLYSKKNSLVSKIFKKRDSPFPWLRYIKH